MLKVFEAYIISLWHSYFALQQILCIYKYFTNMRLTLFLRYISCYYLNYSNFCLIFIFSDDVCPSIGHPRKHVVCYYDGKRPVSSLNVCLCTHIIYTSVGLNEFAKLHLSDSKLKTPLKNTKLQMIIKISTSFNGNK